MTVSICKRLVIFLSLALSFKHISAFDLPPLLADYLCSFTQGGYLHYVCPTHLSIAKAYAESILLELKYIHPVNLGLGKYVRDVQTFVTETKKWDEENKLWMDYVIEEQPQNKPNISIAIEQAKTSSKGDENNKESFLRKLQYHFTDGNEVTVPDFAIKHFNITEDSSKFKDMAKAYQNDSSAKSVYDIIIDLGQTAATELLALFREFKVLNKRTPTYSFLPLAHANFLSEFNKTIRGIHSQADIWLERGYNFHYSLYRGKSTLLPIPFPTTVPGGRFNEMYYWDSYWAMRGLASIEYYVYPEMLYNFFHFIDIYGFIPNGGRHYYLDRSQPPVLGEMTMLVFRTMQNGNDKDAFVQAALIRLIKDYFGFWMNPKTSHLVDMELGTPDDPLPSGFSIKEYVNGSRTNVLNRYYSSVGEPRPESYAQDTRAIAGVLKYLKSEIASGSVSKLYQSIRAAAESGWDFSTRWHRKYVEGIYSSEDKKILQDYEFFAGIDTISIIPVDLNALLYSVERAISILLSHLSMSDSAYQPLTTVFLGLCETRRININNYLMNNNTFVDYDLRKRQHSKVISAAHVIASRAMGNVINTPAELIKQNGITPTIFESGQQWDYPNAWPPLQNIITDSTIQFNRSFQYPNCSSCYTFDPISKDFFQSNQEFLGSVYLSMDQNRKSSESQGLFFEKYHVDKAGTVGGGGEYPTQRGFAWTNGLILDLLSHGIYPTIVPQKNP